MAWFKRKDKKVKIQHKKEIPDGLWEKCYSCNEVLYKPELDKNLFVCHHCQHHFRIEPKIYVNLLLDQGTENRVFNKIESKDFLSFKAIKDYDDQLMKAKIKTGENWIDFGRGKINFLHILKFLFQLLHDELVYHYIIEIHLL